MAKKINFSMTNQESVNKVQSTADAIFAHAMESKALTKQKKSFEQTVEKAVKEQYDGEISKLRDAIRKDESKVDAELVTAIRELGRIEYKRQALRAWYKDEIVGATVYFRLDDIVEELGANNLENGVSAVDKILADVFGLENIAVATRKKFARRVYSAMDGQKKSSLNATTKGQFLSDRSAREIKEVGVRAMCEYIAHTANITLKTKEDYTAEVEYDKDLTAVVGYKCKEA